MQIEEVLQANDQFSNDLRVYEISPKDNEDNDANETGPAKMYATVQRSLMSLPWR